MKIFFHLSIVVTLLITGCATDSDTPTLFAGLSRDRLKVKFGEPLRVERLPGGAEDWYYNFSKPWEVESTSHNDGPPDANSGSLAITKSSGTVELPVHISPEGFVTEPLPRGHIVR